MCSTSTEIDKLAEALAKAQGEMTGASKDALNPHFKSKYADLAAGWDACRGPLSKNGLAVTQGVSGTERGVKVTTILMHSSGQWIRSELDIPAAQFSAQGLGSATTYGRRYSLFAIVGLAPEDDDGNAAVGRGDEQEQPKNRRPARQEKAPPAEQPVNTKRKMADEAQAMSPEELKEYTDLINLYGSRIDQAVSAGDKEAMAAIASDLKNEHERVKGVMRPKYSAGLKVMSGNHLPEGERKPEPTEEQAL